MGLVSARCVRLDLEYCYHGQQVCYVDMVGAGCLSMHNVHENDVCLVRELDVADVDHMQHPHGQLHVSADNIHAQLQLHSRVFVESKEMGPDLSTLLHERDAADVDHMQFVHEQLHVPVDDVHVQLQ